MSGLAQVDDLVHLLDRAARRWPDRTAWIFDALRTRHTFAQVRQHSIELAAALAELGVSEGDRVAVMLRNRPEFPLLWLAVARLGAALVPINPAYRELDGAHVLAHSGATVVVAEPEFVELLTTIAARTSVTHVRTLDQLPRGGTIAAIPDPIPERPANIQYTSGTTGAPKGCVLPHRYWTTLARSLVEEFPAIDATDIVITAQPFHYIDPQWNVALGLASGATLVVLDRFHPSTFMAKVCEYRVSWLYCLGMMPTLLLKQPPCAADRTHRLRAVHASAIPPDLHADLERRFAVPWFESFGMTETGGDIRVRAHDHDMLVGSGCIGTPVPGREAVILGDDGAPVTRGSTGELAIRGTGLMLRYHDDTAATDRAFRGGWFHTGDLARMDTDGRVYYVGRTKDMIRRSGENIAADEVERALRAHPGVALAAVLAVPDEVRGEEVKAYVVPDADAGQFSPDELAEFCSAKLAYFKVPRYWSIVDELPMTPSERIAKGTLNADAKGAYDRVDKVWR